MVLSSPLFSPSPTLPPIHLLFQKSRKEQHRVCGIEEIKVGVEEKKKTQGMRRDLGHKGCGWVNHTPCASKDINFCECQNKYFGANSIS